MWQALVAFFTSVVIILLVLFVVNKSRYRIYFLEKYIATPRA